MLFNSGDAPYFKWMTENPNGYVLNMGKGPNHSFFGLHRSNCMHISKSQRMGDDAYTMRGWVKLVSNDINDLILYCFKNKKKYKGEFKICKTCQPNHINQKIVFPNEIFDVSYFEGAKKEVLVNRYERDDAARLACIAIHGCKCACCELDFEERYGEIGKGFIHVHHKKPLSHIGKLYKVDPENDLIPLCPNCHAMIHKRKIPFTVQELKKKLRYK